MIYFIIYLLRGGRLGWGGGRIQIPFIQLFFVLAAVALRVAVAEPRCWSVWDQGAWWALPAANVLP